MWGFVWLVYLGSGQIIFLMSFLFIVDSLFFNLDLLLSLSKTEWLADSLLKLVFETILFNELFCDNPSLDLNS